MVSDEQSAQIKLIAYFVYFFLLVPFMVVYIDTWVAPILPQMFAYLSAYFYLHLSFCYCYMCSRKAVYLQWKMMRFAATVASVSARKKRTTATHTHTACIQQTHLYLQSQNQMYLEGVLRWQKCGEGHLITIFINFQRMAMQFERILVYEENRQVHKLQTNLIESLKFYIFGWLGKMKISLKSHFS